MRVLLDHSIVGQSATSLTIRKDRRFAGCAICGALFQPAVFINSIELTPAQIVEGEAEIAQWRTEHNKSHTAKQHMQHAESGLTLQPKAANRLAPFGLVPVADAEDGEIADALREAPRAPVDDVETTLKRKSW